MGYLYLSIAIIAEVIGTSALKASQEFTQLGPSIIAIVGYGASLYFLSLVLKTIPVGIAYAIWSGTGITLITVIGAILFKQMPDIPAIIGMILIMSGVVKPLSRTSFDENIRAVIFPVNPVEFSGLVTLAGSVMQGTDPLRAPQGTDCSSIAAFAYAELELAAPRAVLGMLGSDGREVMRRRFRGDIMTLTLPNPLFLRMEQEADDCVFQIPSWEKLVGC